MTRNRTRTAERSTGGEDEGENGWVYGEMTDDEAEALRRELDSLQGTVFAMEVVLGIALLAACKDRDISFVDDLAGTLDDLPALLRSRYRSRFETKPAFESAVIDTIESVSKYMRKHTSD